MSLLSPPPPLRGSSSFARPTSESISVSLCCQAARQRLLDTTKDAVLEFLLSYLPSVTIPPIEGDDDGLVYNISNLDFTKLRIKKDDVSVEYSPTLPPRLTVTAKNMSSQFPAMKWAYKQTYFPYLEGGGKCDASVTGVRVSLTFEFNARRDTPTGPVGPWVSLADCSSSIEDLHIAMHDGHEGSWFGTRGSVTGWFYNEMANLSKDHIRDGVVSSLGATVSKKKNLARTHSPAHALPPSRCGTWPRTGWSRG